MIELVLCSDYCSMNVCDILYDVLAPVQWEWFEYKQFNHLWIMMGDLMLHATPPVDCMKPYVHDQIRVFVTKADAYYVMSMVKEHFNGNDNDKVSSIDNVMHSLECGVTVQQIISVSSFHMEELNKSLDDTPKLTQRSATCDNDDNSVDTQHSKICPSGMEDPILDFLKINDSFSCDTVATNHFVKSKEGMHGFWETEIVLQGITGEAVKTMELIGWT